MTENHPTVACDPHKAAAEPRDYIHRCGTVECPYHKQPTYKSCRCHKPRDQMMAEHIAELEAAIPAPQEQIPCELKIAKLSQDGIVRIEAIGGRKLLARIEVPSADFIDAVFGLLVSATFTTVRLPLGMKP